MGPSNALVDSGTDRVRTAALVIGPFLTLAFILFVDLAPGSRAITLTAAVALLMAIWWITEAIPLAITSLLPLILFPLLGVMNGKTVAAQYCNHIIFLFIGGFMVALAMERWNLHKRIALRILLFFGVKPGRILLGFMVTTAFLSMWISNTATTMMMVTIVMAIILELEDKLGAARVKRFSVGLLLGTAYSASIGGIATLVGTPPNMSFIRILEIQFPHAPEISFAAWFFFAVPITLIMLVVAWLLLYFLYMPRKGEVVIDRRILQEQYRQLGRLSYAEWIVLADFALLVFFWLFRSKIDLGSITLPGWSSLFDQPKYLNDGTVAITMAVLLFLIPARNGKRERVLDWNTVSRLPWNIVLLFGGGFALATGFVESGLSLWVGEQMKDAGSMDPRLLIGTICATITFVTELTSNTATTEMTLPVLAGLATAIQINPLYIMIPMTLSCSCAFMMPVATPPNAIVFGTQRLKISQMAKTGLLLNLFGIIVVLLGIFLLGGPIWGIDLSHFPDWALPP